MSYSRKTNFTLPAGFGDALFNQCASKRRAEHQLTKLFSMRGYSEVITPSVEFLDVFSIGESSIKPETTFKLFDRAGNICVLRPDSTTPIGRMAATRLQRATLPLRLYYTQNVFRCDDQYDGKRSEITQSGIELIGAGGLKADVEIISAAISALDAVGLDDYKLEIGHIGFYKSLSALIAFEDDDRELIHYYTDHKNYAAVTDILHRYEEKFPASCRALKKLPSLFGGNEVFSEAAAYLTDDASAATLAYVKKVYDELVKLGFEDKILLDLGLVHHIDYYTGIVFRGYAGGSGGEVISGGRYDTLHASFGNSQPAVGFAVDVDSVAELSRCTCSAPPPILLHYEPGFASEAYSRQRQIIDGGESCELSLFDSLDEAIKYASARGFSRIICVGSETRELSV